MRRLQVFDGYEENKFMWPIADIRNIIVLNPFKGAVDTANNRRDNLTSFHDVMKSYRWEVRCLAFFLAIPEANAFSAYMLSALDGSKRLHNAFRWRLRQTLLQQRTHCKAPL